MGPSMVAFLKHAYGRAKDADKFLMLQQPALKYTWKDMYTNMHSWGCATRDGVCANASFSQVKTKNKVKGIIDVVEDTSWLRGAGIS